MMKYILFFLHLIPLFIFSQQENNQVKQLESIELSLGLMQTYDRKTYVDIQYYTPEFIDSVNNKDNYFGNNLETGTLNASFNTYWNNSNISNIKFLIGVDYITQVNRGRYSYRVDTTVFLKISDENPDLTYGYIFYKDNNLSYKINHNDLLIRLGGIYTLNSEKRMSFYTGLIVGLGARINNSMKYKYYYTEYIKDVNNLSDYSEIIQEYNSQYPQKDFIDYRYNNKKKLSIAPVASILIPIGISIKVAPDGIGSKIAITSEL